MKKYGFTLAELLIALGIVGVAAALITPTLVNIMPDRYKIRVLQYHAAISTANQELLDDSATYGRKYALEDFSYTDDSGQTIQSKRPKVDASGRPVMECKGGLDCTYKAEADSVCSGANGNSKYANCLKAKLGLSNITNGTYKDKSTWTISTSGAPYTITIDADPSNSTNCVASSDCKRPDTFKFTVDTWGNVDPADTLSKYYIKNPYTVNAKKDRENAGLK